MKKDVSDAEYLKTAQDDLDSRKKNDPKVLQSFDSDGIRLPNDLEGHHRDGDHDRFCKDAPDKYFNEQGKEVSDDTVQIDVRSMK